MAEDCIIIVRHGRPALSKAVRLSWQGFRVWWVDYDASGLADGQAAPENIIKMARESDIVISSPLRRALETARMAAGREPDFIDDDLKEAALPPPHWDELRIGPRAWGTLARLMWYFGWADGMESHRHARLRAARAAETLDKQARDGKQVFITAHGWFNRMLKRALKRRGWKCVFENGDRHWSYRRYIRTQK